MSATDCVRPSLTVLVEPVLRSIGLSFYRVPGKRRFEMRHEATGICRQITLPAYYRDDERGTMETLRETARALLAEARSAQP